jgi:hypothetical protein
VINWKALVTGILVCLGGLVVIVLAIGPKVHGIFRGIKIHSMNFLQRGSKAFGPML